MSTIIQCSQCDTKLKLAVAPAPGQNVKCPKCGTKFTSAAAASAVPSEPTEREKTPPAPPKPARVTAAQPTQKPVAKKKADEDDEEEARPMKSAAKSRRDEDDDSDRDDEPRFKKTPAKSRRDDDDEDPRPRKSQTASRRDDDEEDDPRPRKTQAKSRRDDEDDENPRSRKSQARSRRDDEDDDPRSRKTQSKSRRSGRDDEDDDREKGNGLKIGLIAGGGVLALLVCGLVVWFATRKPDAKPELASSSQSPSASSNDGSSSNTANEANNPNTNKVENTNGQVEPGEQTASTTGESSRSSSGDGGIPEQRLKDLKAATVYVKVEGKQGMATGSGFLIHVNGETGLVATNRHVIAAVPGRFTPTNYSLVFHSGSGKEQVIPAEVVAVSQEQDLAVLKAASKELPKPINLAPARLRETMTIYTLGFPLGETLSKGRGNPAVTIGKGTIGALPEDEHGKLKHVQLDGELNPGNSGGPIIDGDGNLVGIAVSKIQGTKISFAIPSAELTHLLKGSAGAAVVRSININASAAELEIEVPMVDPLGKVKTVGLGYVRKDGKDAPDKDASGAWPQLAGAASTLASIVNGKATAKISVPAEGKAAAEYFIQSQYALADGKTMYARPIEQTVNFSRQGVVKLDGAPPWVTLSSKVIGFTVDMPMLPQIVDRKIRKIAGVPLKTIQVACINENGIYIAYRIDLPAALKPGTEAKFMDSLRDYYVDEWDGVLTGQKNVRAHWSGGWNMGRDFSVNSKVGAKSFFNVRGRFYLIGKMIYMVSVLSMPNTELPDDTGRFLGSLAIGEATSRSNGVPEPERTGTDLPGWGTFIDPDKDCKVAPRDKGMTIEVPGKLHEMDYDGGLTNSPRVLQEVEGDFVVTVKVTGSYKLGPKTTNPKNPSIFISGGILLWSDANNHVRLERCGIIENGRQGTGAIFEEREGGYCGAMHTEWMQIGDCYLRAERKGNKIFGATSTDGKTWKDLKPIDVLWPKKIKLGLSATSSSSTPFSVNFDEFSLKTK